MNDTSIRYKISSESMPCVEVELDPGQSIIAEAGAMTYFDGGVKLEVKFGDGADSEQSVVGKIFSAAKRLISDESLFITHFTNNTSKAKKVAFSAPFPGQIKALDLSALGGTLICQKNAFICAPIGTRLSVSFTKKSLAGFFGGEGFILQKIEGEMAFIHAGGCIVEKILDNDTIYLETGSLVAFTGGITFDIETTTSIKSVMFGKEGLYLTKLSGNGKVWIQSMSFSRYSGVMFDALEPRIMKEVNTSIRKAK